MLRKIDAYWRAANYLAVGQIYRFDNPLLKEPPQGTYLRDVPATEHPHGLGDREFDVLFTRDRPVIFAYHGYPWLIHRLTYRRTNHPNFHVRGYKEEGTMTTPFDMTVLNDLDRFHLVEDVVDRPPALGSRAAYVRQAVRDKLIDHFSYVRRYGEDMPEVRD